MFPEEPAYRVRQVNHLIILMVLAHVRGSLLYFCGLLRMVSCSHCQMSSLPARHMLLVVVSLRFRKDETASPIVINGSSVIVKKI
jgi:hypothetical protein